MIELFETYKNSGKITEALIVGQNLFNKNPGNREVFDAYFSFLCSLAESLPLFSDRQQFASQANVALAFYKENVDITNEIVKEIFAYQNRIDGILVELERIQTKQIEEDAKATRASNSNSLKKLFALKDKLIRSSSKEEFDFVLKEIGNIDMEINKDEFTDEQNQAYESLTKEDTEIISSKMRELEYKENVSYNKKAADSFAKAFDLFKSDESKYKNQTQLFSLVSSTLFAFDASRLFNETLIYYNHVYSYIFNKMDDDGKLALTRYSIECERKLR